MSAVLVALGGFPVIVAGCVFYGIGMAGWPLQLGLLRRETPAGQIGWRTAIYRVGVDGGIFLGPFLSGLLTAHAPHVLPAMCATALIAIGIVVLVRR